MPLLRRKLYQGFDQVVRSEARFMRAAELLPFGWEYWDIDVVAAASNLSAVADASHDVAGTIFKEWLEAHIAAWERYWSSTKSGTGPLKTRRPT